MKSMVRWAVDNTPAMNIAMIALLAAGTWCMASMQREFWPYYVPLRSEAGSLRRLLNPVLSEGSGD